MRLLWHLLIIFSHEKYPRLGIDKELENKTQEVLDWMKQKIISKDLSEIEKMKMIKEKLGIVLSARNSLIVALILLILVFALLFGNSLVQHQYLKNAFGEFVFVFLLAFCGGFLVAGITGKIEVKKAWVQASAGLGMVVFLFITSLMFLSNSDEQINNDKGNELKTQKDDRPNVGSKTSEIDFNLNSYFYLASTIRPLVQEVKDSVEFRIFYPRGQSEFREISFEFKSKIHELYGDKVSVEVFSVGNFMDSFLNNFRTPSRTLSIECKVKSLDGLSDINLGAFEEKFDFKSQGFDYETKFEKSDGNYVSLILGDIRPNTER